jgi:aminoglycoside phosphotransferase (APT) family kinase protein
MSPPTTPQLNWKTDDINQNNSLSHINWPALTRYATTTRRQRDGVDNSPCQLSPEYNMGGLHVVRRIDFADNVRWLARLQLKPPTPASSLRLLTEVHTMAAVRSMSQIPVPEVFAYDAAGKESGVGAAFMLMEFVPGDTAMDAFGGWETHKGETPAQYKGKFHEALADIQTEMASIRFSTIGTIVVRPDGEFDVGPIPGVGGPFSTAAEYFEAWAKTAKYPYKEATVRSRTPADFVEEILAAIRSFPGGVQELAGRFPFRDGPFPLIHTDLYSSNVIIDKDYNVLSVIDWENAIVGPWELVEFNKQLSVVPPAMDGPLFRYTEWDKAMELARVEYVELVQRAEEKRGYDNQLSTVLSDEPIQAFAHAFWLYGDGRIGFYDRVLENLLQARKKPT